MRLGAGILICLAAAAGPAAQPVPGPLVLGETFTIESDILAETRRINVYAPAGYAESDTLRLPVLYMPDGGIHEDFPHIAGLVHIGSLNGTMRPHILVGIENTERRRDLTGPTEVDSDREIAPRVGGSAAFRAFIRDELVPAIEGMYRTTGERAIVGESLAGLFVVETLLLEPALFDTYIAVDPSMWWNGGRLAADAASIAARGGLAGRTLFVAVSSEGDVEGTTTTLVEALSAAPGGPALTHAPMPEEYHHSVFHPAALAGFRSVLGPAGE